MYLKFALYFIISGLSISLSTQDKTVIVTTSGPIRGKLVNDVGVEYYSYQGIPYAENPTGLLRFKPPVPKSPWTDVLNATKEGPVCPQVEGDYEKSQMSEDCLFVNVYVPANKTGHLAVFAYVHGGEFQKLSGNADIQYGPQLLLKHYIIFVTFNYRLGPLGFLSLDEEDASGNAGLKDILLVMKWIKENINAFGGDPNKITIGGNSAGSVAAHYIMLSEKSSGLFNQAILISGSALGYRFLARHAKQNAFTLKDQLGIRSNDTVEILQNLKEMDAFDIVQAADDMGQNDTRKGFRPYGPFVSCIEIEYKDALITREPREILKDGIPQNVPVLVGFNNNEGLKMYPAVKTNNLNRQNLNNNFELCIPSDIEYPYGSKESRKLAKRIKDFYFSGEDISNHTMQNFIDLVTDTMFSYSIDSWIKVHKENVASKVVYYYVYGFDGDLNWFKITNHIDWQGMGHGDELGYTFATKATKPLLNTVDQRSKDMVDTWTTLLTHFVKFGVPTPKEIWLQSGQQRNHAYINGSLQNLNDAPLLHRQRFWQNVYEEYYTYVQNGGLLENKSP